MTARLPRLRRDLTVQRQEAAEGAVFVVKDPRDDQFYRLPEEAYFVAEQLDGATPLGIVRQRVQERFATPVPPAELSLLVQQLAEAGLLEDEANGKPNRRRRRVEGSPLYLRVRLFDPERLFNRLIGKLGFFFTPGFLLLSAVVIFAAVCVIAANWEEATRSLSRLYQLSGLPVISLVVFLIIVAHEFGHGMTCKHFGGQVHEMGFLLIYFQPAFYCNVSDAWLFPEKSKRLWVGIAGPYFELFIWGLATLLWRLTDVETTLNYLAFIVVTTSGIKTLFNLNPLIKLDGYYLLSDWLGIPNLRKQGFAFVRDGFCRLFTGRASSTMAPMSAWSRRVCLTYGLIATVGSLAALGFAFSKLGRYLLVQRQPLAFLFFAGLFTTKIRSRLGRLVRRSPSLPAEPGQEQELAVPPSLVDMGAQTPPAGPSGVEAAKISPKALIGMAHDSPEVSRASPLLSEAQLMAAPASPQLAPAPSPLPAPLRPSAQAPRPSDGRPQQDDRGVRPVEQLMATSVHAEVPVKSSSAQDLMLRPRERPAGVVRRRLLLILLCEALTVFLIYGRSQLRIGGPFDVLPVHNADVRAAVEGIVEEICVTEGSRVRAQDTIARLSDRDLRADLARTLAKIDENRAKLKVLEDGARPEEIQLAQNAVARAAEQLEFLKARLGRDQRLYDERLESLNDLEESRRQTAAAKSDLTTAREQLDLLQAGSRDEDIDAMKAELASLETQRKYLEEQLVLMRVVSPADGIVATPQRELEEMKHQLVKKGDLIAKVYDLKTVTAEIPISERDIADIQVGQPVILKVRAFPEATFHGKVTAIATAAQVSATASATTSALAQIQTPVQPGTLNRSAILPKSVLVTTEIDNSSLLLKPEMTGQAKVFCGERSMLQIMIRRIARTVKVEFWSWW